MITSEIWSKIEQAFVSVQFGTISLIIQDAKLIQLEKHEKIRLLAENTFNQKPTKAQTSELPALRKIILEAISGLRYGQVVFVIKNGQVVQVERTDKSRMEGLFGDGI